VKEAWDGVRFLGSAAGNGDVILTVRDKTVYAHLVKSPATTAVILRQLNVLPVTATLLNTDAPVQCDVNRLPVLFQEKNKTALRLYNLPVEQLANEVPVIRLDFDRPIRDNELARSLPERMGPAAK